ncbi:hypothetical protein AXF42_Ash014079 [Apostasia shenzhenica]|uniref:Transmembrane protein n=1 Tax=Apostasia shenzhenica TaxID=1088818 RepID=A0A2I0A9C7_9ASPA|nr:hypothetical protein AXF42_Ash014079 [Apostasia shenzhenica]
MASSSLLRFFVAVSFLSAGVNARPGVHFHPCKTLFISNTYNSSSGAFDFSQISSTSDTDPSSSSSRRGFYSVYRVFRPLSSSAAFYMPIRNLLPIIPDRPRHTAAPEIVPSEASFGMSSLQERAKDILVVVAGLLFGVGCGVLTGAIMYLAWSLFTNQYQICGSVVDEDEEEDVTPKKFGYVEIADPAPAKERYERH